MDERGAMPRTPAGLPAVQQPPWVSDGAGLHLEVDPAGGKYWLWRHRFPPTKDGRRQDLRIGPYPRISLKAARDIRDEQKRLLYEDGINPCDAKKRSKDQRWGKHAQLTLLDPRLQVFLTPGHRARSDGYLPGELALRDPPVDRRAGKPQLLFHLRLPQ